jgi:hypothetical protein
MNTQLSPGALVRCGNSALCVWVVRCEAGREGFWHLQGKVEGRTYVTRVARSSDLKFFLSLDIDTDLVAPRSRPGVALDATRVTSWRIGLKSCQRDLGVSLVTDHVCRCLAWLTEAAALLRNLFEIVEIDPPKDFFALNLRSAIPSPYSTRVAFGRGEVDGRACCGRGYGCPKVLLSALCFQWLRGR